MRALERFLLLQTIDQRWREHLHDMDYLQQGIHLRSAAQLDPLVAYKNEAFSLFGDLMNLVWSDYARMIYHVQVTLQDDPASGAPEPAPLPTRTPSPASSTATGGGRVSYSGGTPGPAGAQAIAAVAGGAQSAISADYGAAGADYGGSGSGPSAAGAATNGAATVQPRRAEAEPGRNDLCWCGSDKKYKKCHGA
jgi:preprotein translocase subunit SecA